MVKIKNICNESGVGAFYHSSSYSPTSHTLPFEPYIGEIQLKLDELIRATKGAHNALLDLEELEQDSLDAFKKKYGALAADARASLVQGYEDTGTPDT